MWITHLQPQHPQMPSDGDAALDIRSITQLHNAEASLDAPSVVCCTYTANSCMGCYNIVLCPHWWPECYAGAYQHVAARTAARMVCTYTQGKSSKTKQQLWSAQLLHHCHFPISLFSIHYCSSVADLSSADCCTVKPRKHLQP